MTAQETTNTRQPGAFRRYLSLLEGLADAPPRPSIRDIAERSGLSPATAYRLLNELRDLGVVYDDPVTGKIGLSLRLAGLVDRFDRRDALRTAAIPVMQDLRDLTGETVTIVTSVGRERTAMMQVESRHFAHYGAAIGQPEPLHVGAPGKVILAFLEDPVRAVYLKWFAERHGDEAATTLRDQTDVIRRDGLYLGDAERVTEFWVVSVPVRRPVDPPAALSVVGPSSRFTLEMARDFAPKVLDGAASIERSLLGK